MQKAAQQFQEQFDCKGSFQTSTDFAKNFDVL